jgi:ABC-type nitrate/sulfonate/bicarbonate transport system substrate-binding protein
MVRVIALLSSVLIVAGCAQGEGAPAVPEANETEVLSTQEPRCAENIFEGEPLSLTVVTNSGPHSAPYIQWAEEMGCFAENGVEVTLVQAGAPSDRIAALLAGSGDVIWLPLDPLLAGVINGGIDMTVIAPHIGYSAERLQLAREAREFSGQLILDGVVVSAPGVSVTSLKDLEGKKFGRQSAISNIGVALAFEEAGVDPEAMQWVDVEQSERLNALLRGDVAAAVFSGVNALKAMREGGEFLFYYQAWDRQPGIDNFWVSTPQGAQTKKEEMLRFRQAMWDVYRLLGGAENELEFFEFVTDLLGGEPEDVAAQALPDFYPREVTIDDFENHMAIMFARGDIDATISIEETSLLNFGKD